MRVITLSRHYWESLANLTRTTSLPSLVSELGGWGRLHNYYGSMARGKAEWHNNMAEDVDDEAQAMSHQLHSVSIIHEDNKSRPVFKPSFVYTVEQQTRKPSLRSATNVATQAITHLRTCRPSQLVDQWEVNPDTAALSNARLLHQTIVSPSRQARWVFLSTSLAK